MRVEKGLQERRFVIPENAEIQRLADLDSTLDSGSRCAWPE